VAAGKTNLSLLIPYCSCSADPELFLQGRLCPVFHGVICEAKSFLHGENAGIQQLQQHLDVAAHHTVQDDVLGTAFRIVGEVPVLFQGIFEYLPISAGKGTAVIVDHERLEEDAVFFIDLPERIQQADKAVFSLALCGKNLFQQGELALFNSRENILDCLKVNIESGTMDSGALYDLPYGDAPEFFSRYRSQKARSIFALVRFRAAVYSDIIFLPRFYTDHYSPVGLHISLQVHKLVPVPRAQAPVILSENSPSRNSPQDAALTSGMVGKYGNSIAENQTL